MSALGWQDGVAGGLALVALLWLAFGRRLRVFRAGTRPSPAGCSCCDANCGPSGRQEAGLDGCGKTGAHQEPAVLHRVGSTPRRSARRRD